MPTPRKYINNAERQAAYRERRSLQNVNAPLKQKPRSVDSTVSPRSGNRRWRAVIEQAHSLIQTVREEMQLYYDERTDQWQESERGEKHSEMMEMLEEIVYLMQDLS
jgi:hypothetical protein